jgi:hypothetical protein
MEVGQGTNWGCSAKEKKCRYLWVLLFWSWSGLFYIYSHLISLWSSRVVQNELLWCSRLFISMFPFWFSLFYGFIHISCFNVWLRYVSDCIIQFFACSYFAHPCHRCRDSSFGTITRIQDERPRNVGSIPGTGKINSSPQRPNEVWGLSSLLSYGYRE